MTTRSRTGFDRAIAAAARRARALVKGSPSAGGTPPKRQYRELAFHKSVAEFFARCLFDDVVWFHVPNGEERDKATAAKLKAMGARAGVLDFILIYRSRVYFLELKGDKGRRSVAQIQFMLDAEAAGAFTATAYDLPEVAAILRRWGIPTRAGSIW